MLSPVADRTAGNAGNKALLWLKSPYALWPAGFASLFAGVYFLAYALRFVMVEPSRRHALAATGAAALDSHTKDIVEAVAAVLCVAAGFLAPDFLARQLGRIERLIARFAAHRVQAIVLAGLFPMVVRLALLPALPIPQPLIADEFGYLFLADTLASGRIANPAHPLWQSFDTIYILQHPTYASIYPIAPAIPLAIAVFLGLNPWLGVWLSAGLMCSLICWMLQGWMPARWALPGALIAGCRLAIVNPWMNTFWGGAMAAAGGALLVGSLPRIVKHCRVRDGFLLGLGVAILAQSRPFEGFLVSAPVLLWLAIWLVRTKKPSLHVRLTHIALPAAAVLAALASGTAFYNWRVTGNSLVMPYKLYQSVFGMPQNFFWQPPVPDAPGVHAAKDIHDVFQWQLEERLRGFSWAGERERLTTLWRFFLQPLLTLPLLFLPFILRDPRMRLLLFTAFLLMAGNSQYPFFFPHYAAPICGVLVLFFMQGMRHLRAFKSGVRRPGRMMYRCVVVMVAFSALMAIARGGADAFHVTAGVTPRSRVTGQLTARGGRHLVFVRYGEEHSFHHGIIYNAADIDRSPIVWARDIDPQTNQRLIDYYPGREVWRLDPDREPAVLSPFTDAPFINFAAGAAGRRDDTLDGVAPGSIAVIFAGNIAPRLRGTTNTGLLSGIPVRVAEVMPDDDVLFAPVSPPAATATEVPAGLSVAFGGTAARILAVSNFEDQQSVTVLVPAGLEPGRTVVTLRAGSGAATGKTVVRPVLPGIFQMRMSDATHRAILLRTDGSLVDVEHPAHRRETLRMFVTGLGAVPGNAIAVGVNGRTVPILYAKSAEAMPGLQEIAFTLPDNTPRKRDVLLWLRVTADGKAVYSNKTGVSVK